MIINRNNRARTNLTRNGESGRETVTEATTVVGKCCRGSYVKNYPKSLLRRLGFQLIVATPALKLPLLWETVAEATVVVD